MNKLQAKDVDITAQITEEKMNPAVSFLISWVIPVLMFWILGRLLFKRMNGVASNAMSFGKSNAKV